MNRQLEGPADVAGKTPTSSRRVAVIGAGFAGLAAAAVLAARGHEVTLLDGAATAGGKASAITVGDARVDLGPTVLLDLAPFEALCAAVGASPRQVASLHRVDPGILATFSNRRRFALGTQSPPSAADLRVLDAEAPADWPRFLSLGARADRLAAHYYERGDVRGPRDLMSFLAGGRPSFHDFWPFARTGTLEGLLASHLRSPALRRLLGHFARFIGVDARQAPAAILVIAHLIATQGVWYPRGGFATFADALLGLARNAGVCFEPRTHVAGLEVLTGRVVAVRIVDKRQRPRLLPVDACVAAVDPDQTARWLPGTPLARRVARLRPALSARVAWWVIEGEPEQPTHHALHFLPGSAEPLYVATPTVTDASLAPAGVSILYALVHAEPGERASEAWASKLRGALSAAGSWIAGRVRASGVAGGEESCYGTAIGPGLLASLRPSQSVDGLDNLVLAGGGVFPGPGVSNTLRSGLRAARLVEAALAGRRR